MSNINIWNSCGVLNDALDNTSELFASYQTIDMQDLALTKDGGGGAGISQTIAYMFPGDYGSSGTTLFKTGTNMARHLWQQGAAIAALNFNRPVSITFAINLVANSITIEDLTPTDIIRVQLGKPGNTTFSTISRIDAAGIGFEISGRNFNLLVHNGTTLNVVQAPNILEGGTIYIIRIDSDGVGNVKLFVNGLLATSSSNGPIITNPDVALTIECSNGAGTSNPVYTMRRDINIRT